MSNQSQDLEARIQKILTTEEDDFAELAQLMGRNLLKDYAGANLEGVDLEGKDLSGGDFTQTNFRGANLRGVNFSGAKLRGAILHGADLTGANLDGADLTDIELDPLLTQHSAIKSINSTSFIGSYPVNLLKKLRLWKVRTIDGQSGVGSVRLKRNEVSNLPQLSQQKVAIVDQTISPQRKGMIRYHSASWSAQCESNDTLHPGTKVYVIGRRGSSFIVTAKIDESTSEIDQKPPGIGQQKNS